MYVCMYNCLCEYFCVFYTQNTSICLRTWCVDVDTCVKDAVACGYPPAITHCLRQTVGDSLFYIVQSRRPEKQSRTRLLLLPFLFLLVLNDRWTDDRVNKLSRWGTTRWFGAFSYFQVVMTAEIGLCFLTDEFEEKISTEGKQTGCDIFVQFKEQKCCSMKQLVV